MEEGKEDAKKGRRKDGRKDGRKKGKMEGRKEDVRIFINEQDNRRFHKYKRMKTKGKISKC